MSMIIFRGSCPKCGVYQNHEQDRCEQPGCLVLHYYPTIKCECGEVLWEDYYPNSVSIPTT